ncbi:MAG: hypothetical protein LBN27_05335 [Prevotellaceae bacterium]|jgi:hypothetical protein|nr:hypothetical protein [Prevotellaceae bacterium]
MKKTTYLILIIFVIVSSCKTDEPKSKLVPITMETNGIQKTLSYDIQGRLISIQSVSDKYTAFSTEFIYENDELTKIIKKSDFVNSNEDITMEFSVVKSNDTIYLMILPDEGNAYPFFFIVKTSNVYKIYRGEISDDYYSLEFDNDNLKTVQMIDDNRVTIEYEYVYSNDKYGIFSNVVIPREFRFMLEMQMIDWASTTFDVGNLGIYSKKLLNKVVEHNNIYNNTLTGYYDWKDFENNFPKTLERALDITDISYKELNR